MRFRLIAVVFVGTFLAPIASTQAQTDTNSQNHAELPFQNTYNYREDPFLLEWTFLAKKQDDQDAVSSSESRKESLLVVWKEKQLGKWLALPKERFTVNASAYTASADECGNSKGITSSGLKAEEGHTIACPPEFPFGAKIYIEGVGERLCEDRGGAIKGNHIDIYVETKKEAFAFGRKNLEAYVVE